MWHRINPIAEIERDRMSEDWAEGNPQKNARIKNPNRNPPVGPNKKANDAPKPAKTGSPTVPSAR